MEKNVTIMDIIQSCKINTSICGELQTLVELLKLNRFNKVQWIGGNRYHKEHCDILCDNLKIEVKSCNRDNSWALKEIKKDPSFNSGFDRVNTYNFNYIVCVSFDNEFKDTKFFIFNSKEADKFRESRWKSAKGTKNIEIRKYENEELNKIIVDSRDAWGKIKSE